MPTSPVSDTLGFEQLASLSSATALSSIPANNVPCVATIQCDPVAAKPVRWRNDGTNPTANVGMVLMPGVEIQLVDSLSAFRVIEVEAGAKVNVYYGPYPEKL